MRVTDHTNYQNGQDMYRKKEQPDQTGLNRQNSTGEKPDYKAAGWDKTSTAANRQETSTQKKEEPDDPIKRLRQKMDAAKKTPEVNGHSTLYSSTADLMSIANTENQEVLRAIYVRLSFKLWSVRAAGVTNTNKKAISKAARSIEKVMGKAKGKIKNLQKEDEMEKKAEAARKAKMRRLQQELRRELAIKRKIRKNKERKDIADSYLESDGQYSVKGYREHLPEEVQLQLEMQKTGTGDAATAAASLAAMDTAMTIDSSVVSMSTEAAISSAGGVIVDLAL